MGKGLGQLYGVISPWMKKERKLLALYLIINETPGLGAEISQDFFEEQFIGKSLSDENGYKAIEVNKPGSPLT